MFPAIIRLATTIASNDYVAKVWAATDDEQADCWEGEEAR